LKIRKKDIKSLKRKQKSRVENTIKKRKVTPSLSHLKEQAFIDENHQFSPKEVRLIMKDLIGVKPQDWNLEFADGCLDILLLTNFLNQKYEDEDINVIKSSVREYIKIHSFSCEFREVNIIEFADLINQLSKKEFRDWDKQEIEEICIKMKGVSILDVRNCKDRNVKGNFMPFYSELIKLCRTSIKVRRALDPYLVIISYDTPIPENLKTVIENYPPDDGPYNPPQPQVYQDGNPYIFLFNQENEANFYAGYIRGQIEDEEWPIEIYVTQVPGPLIRL